MALLATDAIVLHAFDYLESSRILRLVTREAGVRSALAKGARRSSRRFGSALDLFAQGTAQLHAKPGRDLDTLSAFDVTRPAPSSPRISGGSPVHRPIAELTLRFGRDAAHPRSSTRWPWPSTRSPRTARAGARHDARRRLAHRRRAGLRAPLDVCAECHSPLPAAATVMFSHPCRRCALRALRPTAPRGRVLPPDARDALCVLPRRAARARSTTRPARAHQRFLREFLAEHLTDGRPLRALELWEDQRW